MLLTCVSSLKEGRRESPEHSSPEGLEEHLWIAEWGTVQLHHYEAHRVVAARRSICDAIGRPLRSLQIMAPRC